MTGRVFGCVALTLMLSLDSGCGQAAPPQAPLTNDTPGTAPAAPVSFASDVRPILESHCDTCHLGGGVKGGFNMDTREAAIIEGRNGPRIAPGNSADSALIRHVKGEPGVKRMPPKGEPLTDAEIATLTAWIDQGAPWQ